MYEKGLEMDCRPKREAPNYEISIKKIEETLCALGVEEELLNRTQKA